MLTSSSALLPPPPPQAATTAAALAAGTAATTLAASAAGVAESFTFESPSLAAIRGNAGNGGSGGNLYSNDPFLQEQQRMKLHLAATLCNLARSEANCARLCAEGAVRLICCSVVSFRFSLFFYFCD